MAKKNGIRRIGILTGGGDCPGLNAVIRGVTKPAEDYGMSVYGIIDGFEGLVEGKYDIQFFDDADNDGNPDPGKNEFIVSISVRCEEE